MTIDLNIFIFSTNYLKLFKNIWNELLIQICSFKLKFFRKCREFAKKKRKAYYQARWSLSPSLLPSLLCNYVTLHLTTQRIKFNGGSHVRQTAIRWLIIPFCSLMNRDFHRIVVAVHPLSSGCLPFSSLRFKLANLSENSSARKGWSRSAIINPEESRLIGN